MALKLFKLQDSLMIDPFIIKLTQLEKTRSMNKFSIMLENLMIKVNFENKSRCFFAPFA